MLELLKEFDYFFQDLILSNKSSLLIEYLNVMRIFGIGHIMVPGMFYFFWIKKYRVKEFLIDSFAIMILILFFKYVTHKARPITGMYLFLGPSTLNDNNYFSFISGDVCVSYMVYYYLKEYLPQIFLIIISVSVAMSRLYLNMHWMSDVLMAYILMISYFYCIKEFVFNGVDFILNYFKRKLFKVN